MADPRNFLLNTDYPMDKIAGYFSGSYSASGSPLGLTIPHSLGIMPLCIMTWSLDPNFNTSYQPTGIVSVEQMYCNCYSTTTSIVLQAQKIDGGAFTVYYRIYYFLPENSTLDVPGTSTGLDNFVLNTDYNYCKVYMAGTTTGFSAEITHNLGYYPQVDVWRQLNNVNCTHVDDGDPVSGYGVNIIVTTTKINITAIASNYPPGSTITWHYRIYADEN